MIAVIAGIAIGAIAGLALPKTEEAPVLEDVSLPGAGAGDVIQNYLGATQESSINLLSTTALGAGFENINEYYDSHGSSLGKHIVYTGKKNINVYNKIPGNERIEHYTFRRRMYDAP